MSMQFEQIIEAFVAGSSTLEATCQQLTSESSADASRTRFWGQRVESEMRRGRVPAAAARAMLDALEGFQCDKTMWLDPSLGVIKSGPVASAPATTRDSASKRATNDALRDANEARVEWIEGAPAPVHSANLETIPLGTIIKDRYRLIAPLGAGGVGQVFDAIDLAQVVETHVTVKIVAVNLKYEPYAFDALKTAVTSSQHLEHPNIAKVFEIDQHEDRVFIVMEPLRGRWLSGIVREVRRKGMPFEVVWPIVTGVANGLAHAHRHGVVHSDLSPHAVFICDDGTAKIMGFGLVHAVPASNESLDILDTLTLRAYTEAYTADAWAQQGKAHPADDLYPLGVMAYEMLAGVHPFQRCSLAVARQKELTFAPIAGLNRRARKLLERCLSFERDVRPQDAARFLRGLRPGMFERLLTANATG